MHRLEADFPKTRTGRNRSSWIVLAVFFVASDRTYPVQTVDLAIYCVNWGFRLPTRPIDAPVQTELADGSSESRVFDSTLLCQRSRSVIEVSNTPRVCSCAFCQHSPLRECPLRGLQQVRGCPAPAHRGSGPPGLPPRFRMNRPRCRSSRLRPLGL